MGLLEFKFSPQWDSEIFQDQSLYHTYIYSLHLRALTKMADEDVQALVVDNGSGMCKVNKYMSLIN